MRCTDVRRVADSRYKTQHDTTQGLVTCNDVMVMMHMKQTVSCVIDEESSGKMTERGRDDPDAEGE
jgi:hypothetical protein